LKRRRDRFVRIRVLDSDELTRRTRPDDHLRQSMQGVSRVRETLLREPYSAGLARTIEEPPERMSALGARTRKTAALTPGPA
jgi:hypothetical protein